MLLCDAFTIQFGLISISQGRLEAVNEQPFVQIMYLPLVLGQTGLRKKG